MLRHSLIKNRRSVTVLLLALTLVMVGSGAAVGLTMGGDIQASVPVTVSQALVAQKAQRHNVPPKYIFPADRNFFGSVSDDSTKFSIALEMYRGEELSVLLPLVNRSSGDTVAELTMTLPTVPSAVEGVPGLTVSAAGWGQIDDVVRISPNTWTFTAAGDMNGAEASPPDGLVLTFKVAPTAMAGYLEISGRIRVVDF